MPAGRGNQCSACYYENLAAKRTAIDRAAFRTPAFARHFEAFAEWLKETCGPKKAAHRIHRFLPFFVDIEREWGAMPDYPRLLSHFGASKLRKVRLATQWMEESGLAIPDAKAKRDDSDLRRIQATLDRFAAGTRARTLLASYHAMLGERRESGRTSIHSVRIALAAAAGLLDAARELDTPVPNQRALDTYLSRAPGQRAALSGFIAHLRKSHDLGLQLPPLDRHAARRKRRRKLRAQLLDLMRTCDSGGTHDDEHRWIALALAYFHDVPSKVASQAATRPATAVHNGLSVLVDGRSYWIPLARPRDASGLG